MRFFKYKKGFNGGTAYIQCSDDGKHAWLVDKNGSKQKCSSAVYNLSYCLDSVEDGEYEEIFLAEVKEMKREIIIKSMTVSLLVGKELSNAEIIAINKIDEVTHIHPAIGEVDVVIPNKKASSLEIDLIKRKINRALELAPYKQATESEATDIWASVDQWFDNAPMTSMFKDCKGITKRSVAEYTANMKNLTLFDMS